MYQRPPTAGLDPNSDRWPSSRRAAVGALAVAPSVLLVVSLVGALFTAVLGAPMGPIAVLFYAHVVSQFLIVLLFSHFALTDSALKTTAARTLWITAFLFAAPVAVPAYWILHMRAPSRRTEDVSMRVVTLGTEPIAT